MNKRFARLLASAILTIFLVFAMNLHAAGNLKPSERLVIIFPQAFGFVFILDLVDNVVAIPKNLIGIGEDNPGLFYSTFAPGLVNAADLGQPTNPNLETILNVRPDMIIASKATEHSTVAINTMRDSGIKVLQLNVGFGSVEEWLGAVNLVANATRTDARAKKYEAFYRKRLKLVEDRLASTPVAGRPKVALVNTAGTQMVIRGSRTTFGYDLITLAGGRLMERGDDPADAAGCAELMFAFDPDIIIDDAKTDVFARTSWWQALRAVKTNRALKTPADDKQAWVTNWFLPAYSPIGLLWLAKKIHPEKFADIDLIAEHDAFCQMLYGKPFTHSGSGFSQ